MLQNADASPAPLSSGLESMAKTELERAGFRLRFPAPLEVRYERDIAAERVKDLRFIVLWGATLYFILGVLLNLTVIPQPDWHNVAIQLVGPTVVALAIRFLWLRVGMSSAVRETALMACGLLCTVSAILVVAAKPEPATLRDFLLAIPPTAFVLVFVRLRFRQAIAFFLVNTAVYALALSSRPEIGASDEVFLIGFMGTLLMPALLGSHTFERAARRVYLHGLLDRLRNESLTARNSALADLSYTDSLTGIPNRRQLDEALALFVTDPESKGALLLVDIDMFKAFNDRYGHLAGDACLRQVAQCLLQRLQRRDLLTRFGGEEFAVLMPDAQLEEAAETAERLREAVQREPFSVQGSLVNVTISIGVAVRQGHDLNTPDALIGAADTALYAAKHAGRNRVRVAGEPALQAVGTAA
ncbi:GGDEF domain-containing protein [Bordetella sp. N]|uniref:GGDEF domain-containing protein n=1 Tax=Bordetella sp. N TaxID=1746199 RepID=UPI0007089466|nr:GGDEF domain-containing protein [Bordetella sp. N]ALM84122.1 hypothetical protein ASB57_15105 [Bordetella sp. N]